MDEIKATFERSVGVHRYADDVYLVDPDCVSGNNTLFPLTAGREITTDKTVFLMCHKGSIDLKLNYRRVHLSESMAMIILPEMIIETLAVGADAEVYTMLLSEKFTNSLNLDNAYRTLLSVRRHPLMALPAQVGEALFNLYAMVRGLLADTSHPNLDRVLRLLFEAYFYGIDPYLHTAQQAVVASVAEQHTDEFLKLVERNFRQHTALDWYAQQLNLSPKRLSICVKQTTDRTATSWIERHRLIEACRLLRDGGSSVKQVAAALHFPNQSAFGTWFKRNAAVAPSQYCKQASAR